MVHLSLGKQHHTEDQVGFVDIQGLCTNFITGYMFGTRNTSIARKEYHCETYSSRYMTRPECVECLCSSLEDMKEQLHGEIDSWDIPNLG